MNVPSRHELIALGVHGGPSEVAAIRNMIRHDDRNALQRVGRECATQVVRHRGVEWIPGARDNALIRMGINDWQVVPLALVKRRDAVEAVALWRAIAEGVEGVELNVIHSRSVGYMVGINDTGELLAGMCLDRVIFPVGCRNLDWACGSSNCPRYPATWRFIKKARRITSK